MTVSNTPGCGVEYPEYGDEAVAGAVCAADVGAGCTDVAEALRHTSTRTPTYAHEHTITHNPIHTLINEHELNLSH